MDQEVDTGYFVLPCEFIEAGKKAGKKKSTSTKKPSSTKRPSSTKKTKNNSESFCFTCQSITGDINSEMNDKHNIRQSECGKCKGPKKQYMNMGNNK